MHPNTMRRRLPVILAFLILGAALAATDELRCRICGIVIPTPGKYYRVEGSNEVYCERCYLEAPRCTVCKLPTAPAEIDAETGACKKCLAKLPRCNACGKAILGTFYRYPYGKGVYCAECKKNRPACDLCGVPVGDRHYEYPDGRIICSDCGGRAIFDDEIIKGIVRSVRAVVERRLGMTVKLPYTVRIEQLSGVGSAHQDHGGKVASRNGALYGKELGMYRLDNGKSEIILLFGLPPDLLYEAAAHEYAHAWLAENTVGKLDDELSEGFSQWVAAEVLRDQGFRGALEKLEARTDAPYGTGYQKLKLLHQKAVMDLLRNRR